MYYYYFKVGPLYPVPIQSLEIGLITRMVTVLEKDQTVQHLGHVATPTPRPTTVPYVNIMDARQLGAMSVPFLSDTREDCMILASPLTTLALLGALLKLTIRKTMCLVLATGATVLTIARLWIVQLAFTNCILKPRAIR